MAVFGNYGGRNPELHVLAQRADDVYDPIFTAEDVGPPISCFFVEALSHYTLESKNGALVALKYIGFISNPSHLHSLSLWALKRMADEAGDIDAVMLPLGRASRADNGGSDSFRDLKNMASSGVRRSLIVFVSVPMKSWMVGPDLRSPAAGEEMSIPIYVRIAPDWEGRIYNPCEFRDVLFMSQFTHFGIHPPRLFAAALAL
jgi:hypothetical protein|tara:strand:- start:540 stop:1145 length:606 start_codon:yes stop_codon:yes gene_type:complete